MKKAISGLIAVLLVGLLVLVGINTTAQSAELAPPNLSSLTKRIEVLEVSNRSLLSKVAAQNERINSLSAMVNVFGSQINSFNGRLSSLSQTSSNMAKQITAINAALNSSGVSGTESRLARLEAFMRTTSPQLGALAKQVQDLTALVKVLQSSGGTSSSVTAQIRELTSRLNSLSGAFTKLSDDLRDLSKVPAIAQLITKLGEMGTRIKAIDEDLKAIHAVIDARPPR